MPSFVTVLRLLTVSALMVVLAGFNQGCPGPHPQITIGPSTDAINGPPRVSAHVVPNQFPVTEVILEFGRRPSTANAVNILYSSEPSSYNLPRTITRNLPTTDPFDVTFTFNISTSGPNPMAVGELFDYQFRVKYLAADGSAPKWWSERRTLQVGPAAAAPPPAPPPGGGGAGGGGGCDVPVANVSRPATGIGGGSTTDLGGSAPVISGDGHFVAFVSRTKFDPNAADVDQIYRRDVQSGAIVAVSRPATSISGGSVTDKGGRLPSISSDGRFVAFVSQTKFDPNAADGDQVYVRDLQGGTILRVSTPATAIGGGSTTDLGGSAPVISGDGHFVAFVSRTKFDPNAADVDQIYRRDVQSGAIVAVSRPATSISGGSVTDKGGRLPSISSDGHLVAFVSQTKFDPNATDGDQLYVRDLQGGAILRVSTPATAIGGGSTTDRGGSAPVISGDGRFVAFVSRTKFDPNAADVDQIYRRDVQSGAIVVVSRPATSISGGSVTDKGGRLPSISSDGRFVAFVSQTKFDPNATDGDQLYVRDLQGGTILRVSTPATAIGGGSTTDRGGSAPVISGDGHFVAFVSRTKFDPNAADVDQIYRRCEE